MNDELKSQEAVLQMTIQVIRKNTGKVEEYHLVGTPMQEPKHHDAVGALQAQPAGLQLT